VCVGQVDRYVSLYFEVLVVIGHPVDHAGLIPVINRGQQASFLQISLIAQFQTVRVFRIEIGVAGEIIPGVRILKEGEEAPEIRPAQPAAVTQLQGVFFLDLLTQKGTWEKVNIRSWVVLFGHHKFSSDIRIFHTQSGLG